MYGISIDWLAYTYHGEDSVTSIMKLSALYADQMEWTPERGLMGYTHQFRHGEGVRILYTPHSHKMGVHAIWDGGALREWREELHRDTDDILRHIMAENAKITRVDVAVDWIHENFDWKGAEELIRRLASEQKSRSYTILDGLESGGKTFYIGSFKSDAMIRIYDKAAERHITGFKWARLELVLKRDKAKAWLDSMRPNNEKQWASAARLFLVGKMPHGDHAQIKTLYTDLNMAELPSTPKPQADYERWIDRQVMPAMQHMARDARYRRLLKSIIRELAAIIATEESNEEVDFSPKL